MVYIMKILRQIPAVHQLKKDARFLEKETIISEKQLTEWLAFEIDVLRNQLIRNEIQDDNMDREGLTALIFKRLEKKINSRDQHNLQKVVNATGVVLHTNLGRARLSKKAIAHIADTASSYSTLEYNLSLGKRGSRHDIVESYLTKLTGAEAAMVVNNNAAAVYLVLKALAKGQEVIVSRGELVEIGGSFRISEIMEESNAHLVEVGTTNKTYVRDYEQAITDETALLMKVHKSNFKVVGFTHEVDTDELVAIKQTHHIPIYEDLGSGTLFPFRTKGIGTEPTVQEKVKMGIDIISFSGDKLFGGPQAGIIVGKKQWIAQLKQHQLARVLRVDKFTLAGMEATLKSYVNGQEQVEIPTIRDIVAEKEDVLEKVNQFIEQVAPVTNCTFQVKEDASKVGGGTMPEVELDTYIVEVQHEKKTSEELASFLREQKVPIIVRIQKEKVLLDFRTVDKTEIAIIVDAFLQ